MSIRGRFPVDGAPRDAGGLVGRVIEHLDFEERARVVEGRDGRDQPLDDGAFVEHRKLDGDGRQGIERARPPDDRPIPVVEVHHHHPMKAVNREREQHRVVRG
jgi:hypothetical protein